MAVAFAMQPTSLQTPPSAKTIKMRPSRVIVCSNHHEFGYLVNNVVCDNQPRMTQQHAYGGSISEFPTLSPPCRGVDYQY
eukprot:scaffold39781_cov45-Cyclotella_meneghiniana.AAC.3